MPITTAPSKRAFVRDLASGLFESASHDAHADELVTIGLELVESGNGAEQSAAAAGNDATVARVACMAG